MEAAGTTVGTDASTISFGDVLIDLGSYELFRGGEPAPVEPQVFDVLRYLIENRDRVVGKLELLDNVWGDRFVSESALTSRIKSARRAVGDDGRRQEIIRTSHGRGYRFVAEIDDVVDLRDRSQRAEGSRDEREESISLSSAVPAPARPLIARDDELAALFDLLGANRLVTLVGPGGVGKTRVATELATRWDHDFDDAVTFVSLATVSGADEVFAAIRAALGIATGDSTGAFGAVLEALTGQAALLVVDNFEHVLDAATTLSDLVEAVPGVRVLVTSRERLGLAGEHVLELEPLALDPDDAAVDSAAAVMFFEHSVRGVRSDLEFGADDRQDIVAICRTLDGLPLAIELAAAQTRYFSLAYVRTHLESQAISVADNARDRPQRHHTMHATIDWSYRLLTPSQQQLLSTLSVYRNGWPLSAAEAINGDEQSGLAVRDLFALVDKSLVQRSEGILGEPRFSMLHLLREFAGAELDASGGRDNAQRRHATFVAELVQSIEARRWTNTTDGWIAAIDAEYADASAALHWCFNGGDKKVGCDIVRALGFWWYRSGRLGEARVWIDHALTDMSAADDATRAWIHAAAGNLAMYELQREESRQHFDVALTLAREIGDDRLEARSLCGIGATASGAPEDYESGLAALQLGLEYARRLESPQLIVHGLTVLGELTRANGLPEQAEDAYRGALDMNAELGDRHYEAVNVLNMGHALMAQDRMLEALEYHRRGIDLSSRIGSRMMMAWNLSALAAAHHLLGRPKLAARLSGTAEAALQLLGATYGPVDQPVHERRQRAIRTDLGDEEYTNLFGEGRHLALEEGVELALEALDNTP